MTGQAFRKMADQELVDDVEGLVAKKIKAVRKLSIPSKEPVFGVQKIFNDENSDVTFVESNDSSSKNKLSAHRMVLSVTSPYFYKMFQGDWKEKDQDTIEVPGGFQWDVFEAVISFLYGEDIEIEEDFILELYKAADYLELDILKIAINEGFTNWELVDNGLVIDFCILARQLKDDRSSDVGSQVYSGSLNYIARHLEEIIDEGVNISHLPKAIILDISQSEMITQMELVLHSFLTCWAEAHVSNLSFHETQEIFGNIRYGTIPLSSLNDIACEEIYNNKLLGMAMRQHRGWDRDVLLEDPLQYCSRKAQEPFPVIFDGSMDMFVTYSGQDNSTLFFKVSTSGRDLYFRLTITSIPMLQMNPLLAELASVGEHVLCITGPSFRSAQDLDHCKITLTTSGVTVHFTKEGNSYLNRSSNSWPETSFSSLKTFPFEAPIPWLIKLRGKNLEVLEE